MTARKGYKGAIFREGDLITFRHAQSDNRTPLYSGTVLKQLHNGTLDVACSSFAYGRVRIHPSCATYAGRDSAWSKQEESN